MSASIPTSQTAQRGWEVERDLRNRVFFTTLVAALGLIPAGVMFATTASPGTNYYTVAAFCAASAYCFVLAFRSVWLPLDRLGRAFRNLILLAMLSVGGVTAVALTHDHHRHFWQQHFPQLAKELR